jgi:hypothetical protein
MKCFSVHNNKIKMTPNDSLALSLCGDGACNCIARPGCGRWTRGYGWSGCDGRGWCKGRSRIQDGICGVDTVQNFANTSHWPQVTLVERDADGCAVACEDLDLCVSVE